MTGKALMVPVITVVMMATMLNLASSLYAQSPTTPQEFKGNVTVNGSPPPPASTVSVRAGGTQIAFTATDSQGRYGYSSPLLVSIAAGTLLEFYVNGVKAQQTATFKPGELTVLNLAVAPESTPTSPSSVSQPPAVTSSIANFIVSNLGVSPSSVKYGEIVTVTAEVRNGGGEGAYTVILKVNDVAEIEQAVTLSSGRTQKLIYTISKEKPGDYRVTINDQSAKFTVTLPETFWLTGQPWWIYVIGGIVLLLIILFIVLIISRRNAYYY
jgi:hypothetical protein